MNNINRGALIGIRLTLEQICDLLESIVYYESIKEDAPDGGAPITPHSKHLDEAITYLGIAIDELDNAVPQKPDFEKWLKEMDE